MASVNKPTDLKIKEADVNRKLQIYGIISAFQAGKVPSNDQIDVALNSFLASKAIASPSQKLSAEGQALVSDFKDVVLQAKTLLLSKNEGNLFQDFIWHSTQFDPKTVNKPNVPVDKQTAKQHGDQVNEGFRTLGTLLITNGQFRKLINDAVILLRDMAGDAAINTAGKVKPTEDKLSQIDAPATDNTWHEKPDLTKEKIKAQLGSVYKGDPKKDVQDAANASLDTAQPGASEADNQAAAQAAEGTLRERIEQNVSEEDRRRAEEGKEKVKETGAQYRARARQYLSKKVPQNRREQTIFRLKKMVLECQQHPDYNQAITTLLDLAEMYGDHARNLTTGATGSISQGRSSLAQAEADLKTLIERFANATSSDDLWASIKTVYDDAERDPELKEWFKSMNRYVRRCLQEQGYIMEEESNREWNRLYDHGNHLLRDRYRGHTDRIVEEIKFLAKQFDEDPANKKFAKSLTKLFHDLGNDASGKPVFKPHLVKDLTEVILPAAFENIAYIPIPRIEFSDPMIDVVVENLVLESDNFMPNVFELASDHYFRWGRKNIANQHKNGFDIKVTGVQMDLRDVSYYVKRKQGFPSITDTGVANIFMGGEGFCFRMKLVSADKRDKQNFFKIEKVDVDVKNLKINLVKSNHKALFAIFKPMMLKVLRPAIQKVAEKQLKDQFNQFDQLMYQVKLEADRALDEAKQNPEQATNIYQRYVTALQKQVMQGKQQAEAIAKDKKVNYAITQEDSIFPNIQLPGGISSKATEYRELARKGEKWESPVFSIGQASKSNDLPSAPTVTRKPHGTTNGAVHTNGHTNGHLNGHTHGAATNGALGGNLGVNGGSEKPLNGASPVTSNPNIVTI